MPRFRRRAMATKGASIAPKKLAAKVRRLETKVASQAPELNYTNEPVAPVNTSLSGSLTNLVSYPAQAAGNSTDQSRLGDKARVKNVEFRMTLNSVNTNCAVRVIIFCDKRNQSSNVNDVIESGTLNLGNNTVNCLYVHDYLDRYRILMDRTYSLGESHGEFKTIVKRFNFKRGLPLEFLAGGTTPIRNALKVIVVGTSAISQYAYQARMNFYP